MDPDLTSPEHAPVSPFGLRTVAVGVRLTCLAAAVAFITPFLPGTTVTSPVLFGLLVLATTALAMCVGRIPWDRELGTGRGALLLELWGLVLVLLVSAALGLAGQPGGEGHLYYYLIVIYFTLVLDVAAQARLVVLTGVALGALSWLADLPPARLVTRVAVLLLVAYLARSMRALLYDRAVAAERAQNESERRSALLATVAGSARALASLDPAAMLHPLVTTAVSLGFDTGNVCRFDDVHRTYEVLAPVGHAWPEYLGTTHPAREGMPGMVLEARAPVVLEDDANHPLGVPGLRQLGYRAVVGVPIWTLGRLDACLIVGTRDRDGVRADEVESLELLAALAGRALENARRFEAEHEEKERQARLAAMKSDFVSNVSHELRTPLTVVEGIGKTLGERADQMTPELRAELIERLNANASSLHDILSRLLDFSRIEAGTLEVRINEVKMCELAVGVSERMQQLLSEHELDTDVDEPLPVRADPVLMERVLENLLSNAAKHTPVGTRVHLQVRRQGATVRVSVSDDGPGIPASEVVHLTERFFRGGDPNTRTRKGLGLGLALVSELLSLHGSRLEIDSEVGRGTSFAFEVPLSTDSPLLAGRYDADLDPARTAPR